MSTTGNEVATRNGTIAAHQSAALAIKPGQLTWDKFQEAALVQIGLREAPAADRAVFLHMCQRTGLDPWSRQIMMIGRPDKQRDGSWLTKWSIQTGIEGWRTIRDRAEKREGLRGILSRFTYYDDEDNERKVWTRPEPPAVVEVTYTVVERGGRHVPYTSQLRYCEYVQLKDGRPVAQWGTKPVHMTEKCTEADVYRRAFPQDYSGIELSDAMPAPDPDAPPAAPERQRVTGQQLRGLRQQHAGRATGEVVDAVVVEDHPWPGDAAPAPGETAPSVQLASKGQVGTIRERFTALGYADDDDAERDARLRVTARLAAHDGPLGSTRDLTDEQAARVIRALRPLRDAAELVALLEDGEVPGGE